MPGSGGADGAEDAADAAGGVVDSSAEAGGRTELRGLGQASLRNSGLLRTN